MFTPNKIIVPLVLAMVCINTTHAEDTNKTTVLTEVTKVKSTLDTLKTDKLNSLQTVTSTLAWKYDTVFTSLGYNSNMIDYLVSLWKLNSNYKTDLEKEVITLTSDINNKVLALLNQAEAVKTSVNIKTTLTEKEKSEFLATLTTISTSATTLTDSFTSQITALNTKYTWNLSGYESTIKSVIKSNSTLISNINNFDKKYDTLFALYKKYTTNYATFKDNYLSYSWELGTFSTTTQKKYVAMLQKELDNLKTLNYESNPTLVNQKTDIERTIAVLLENFTNSLSAKVTSSYWLVFSDSDAKALVTRYETLTNKYFDTDWNLKPSAIWTDDKALTEVNSIYTSLNEVNTTIESLIWSNAANTLSNMQIRMENEMVKFYNETYKSYKDDLLLKIKEKLEIVKSSNNNVLLASDNIDVRITLLNQDLAKIYDLIAYKERVKTFKQEMAKYAYLNSDILNDKIFNITANLDIIIIDKELAQFQYSYYNFSQSSAINALFAKYKTNNSTTYKVKFKDIISKIDILLSWTLSTSDRFMFLNIQKALLTILK